MSTKKGSGSESTTWSWGTATAPQRWAKMDFGGHWFGKGSMWDRMTRKPGLKTPDIDHGGDARDIAAAASEEAMAAAKEKEKSRLRASSGRRSLIATSGKGLLEPVTPNKKKLTGE